MRVWNKLKYRGGAVGYSHNTYLRSVVVAGAFASTTCHPIRSHIARRWARSRCRKTRKPDLVSVATYVASSGS
jgi:hypothetical protein